MTPKQLQAAHALWDALSDILETPGALKSRRLRQQANSAIQKAFAAIPEESRSLALPMKRERAKTCPLCGIQYIGTPGMHQFDCPAQSPDAQAGSYS